MDAALFSAVVKGELEAVKLLADSGMDVIANDPTDVSAVEWAAFYGHLEIVKYLVSVGAHGTNWAVRWAAKNGHLEIVKCLIINGDGYETYNDVRPDEGDGDKDIIPSKTNWSQDWDHIMGQKKEIGMKNLHELYLHEILGLECFPRSMDQIIVVLDMLMVNNE